MKLTKGGEMVNSSADSNFIADGDHFRIDLYWGYDGLAKNRPMGAREPGALAQTLLLADCRFWPGRLISSLFPLLVLVYIAVLG